MYDGDINFGPSTSSAAIVAINAIPTTTSLTSNAATAIAGTPITFKATVSESSPNAISGTVVFLDGTNTLSVGAVSAGVVSFTTSALAAGIHSITAVYSGGIDNDVFAPSTSSAVSVTITPQVSPSFTIALSPTSASVSRGGYITSALTLTPTGGFNQTVSLTCTGAPANSACTISPASLMPSGGNTMHATVSLQTTSMTAMRVTQHDSAILAAVLPAGIFVPVLFFGGARARRRSFFTLIAIATISLLLTTTGCGGAGQAGAPQSASPETVTLTVTAASATITETATWTVSIQ